MKSRICYFISLLICSFQCVGEARSQAVDPSREDVKRLIVRIDSTFSDKAGFGAGIVVGIVNNDVYIATANHVVREGDKAAKEIKVQIRGHKQLLAVRAAPQYSVELDLAILILPQAASHGIDVSAFPFDRLGDATDLLQGDPVFLLGHPQGVPWSLTVTPDAYIEADEDSLRFESRSLFPGHSGGALLNFRLEIIGLLRSDQQPNGEALNITQVLNTVKKWGYPVNLSRRFTAKNIEVLSAGAAHTCFVNPRGQTSCWGSNSSGQLGNGGFSDTALPSPLHGHFAFVSVTSGWEHTCGLTAAAQAFCWGDNSSDALGTGPGSDRDSMNNRSTVPTPVSGGLSFAMLSAGQTHTCGVTTSRMAYCWGDNQYGQLGTGTKKWSASPVPVAGSHKFRSIYSSVVFSCGLTDAGSAWCWGDNSFGKLGNGATTSSLMPVQVAGNLKFISLSAGDTFACGIASDGHAYCWGNNEYGQLGTKGKSSPVPVLIPGGMSFASIYAGRGIAYALTQKGGAYSWGTGSLELDVRDGDENITTPMPVFGTRNLNFKALSMRMVHACGVTVIGEVYCWGMNSYGQLGNGSKEETFRPTLVSP